MKENEEKIIEIIDKLRPYLINDGGNIEFIKTDTKSTNSLIIIVGLIIVVIMAVIINQNNNAKPKDNEELDAE